MTPEHGLHLLEGALAVTLVRGTIVFLLAIAATVLVRKLSSEARHLIWLGVIASFVLIPLAWLALPALRVGRGIQLESAAAYRILAVPILARQEYLRFADGAYEYAHLARQSLPPYLRVLPPSLLLAWLVGGKRAREACGPAKPALQPTFCLRAVAARDHAAVWRCGLAFGTSALRVPPRAGPHPA